MVIITASIIGALLFFAWTITLNNNNLIRKEIKSAVNCDSKKMIKDHNIQ
tara:strand:- start:755 stop:904 length:150 start_codon:yes stop_codon:yes gene_type:complete